MTTTPIEWTDKTWNPVRGCARVSPGCEHCYAERQAHRFSSVRPGYSLPYEGLTVLGKHGPRWTGRARFVPEMLGAPLKWLKPQRVFVNSMSDLFHDDVTEAEIASVFGVMAACPQHTFQILTKRPERMLEWFEWMDRDVDVDSDVCGPPVPVVCGIHAANYGADVDYLGIKGPWPLPNVWLGVSCEDQQRADERIPLLLEAPAALRFVSAEPLLEEVSLFAFLPGALRDKCLTILNQGASVALPGVDWVIVGGESGPGARPCDIGWVGSIVTECRTAGVPCFVKQLGAAPSWHGHCGPLKVDVDRMHVSDRKGGDPGEWPADLRVRQFPGDGP